MLMMLEGTTVSGAMGTAIGSIATDALGMITTVIPVAAPILGGIVVIGVGIKIFKKLSR